MEQNVNKTLKNTSRAYILEKGKIVLEGNSDDLAEDDHVRKIYMGQALEFGFSRGREG